MEGVSTKISGDPWDQAWANIRHGRSTCDQRMKEDSVHKNAFKYRERKPGSAFMSYGRLALATNATTIRLMNVCQSTASPA
jgi:hypothetical protein